MQGDDVEAVVEVLAELALPDAVLEVFVCRRDEAEIALDGLCGPEAIDELLLENAQELGLHLQRKLADLVEEDRPLMGKLELARLSLVAGPREGARLVAEKLRLQKILGNGGAVEPDEGQLVALARPVDGMGEEFLPRAALAHKKDRRVHLCRPLCHLPEILHDGAFAHDVAAAVLRGPEVLQFLLVKLDLGLQDVEPVSQDLDVLDVLEHDLAEDGGELSRR